MIIVEEISPHDLEKRLNRGERVRMIDVREPHEVALGMIPGAEHIPMGEIPNRMDELSKDEEIIFICRSGHRSGQVCEYLLANSFKKPMNLRGGMLQWVGEIE